MSISSRVKLDSRFKEVGRRWDIAVAAGLVEGARAGAAVSKQVASKRHDSGKMSDIKVGPVKKSGRGNIYITFYSPAWYARFHEKGTSRGLKPLRFLTKGRTAARKVLLAAIERHMQRVC